jgi:hypothetical protein
MVDQVENEELIEVGNSTAASKNAGFSFGDVFLEDSSPVVSPKKSVLIDREEQLNAVYGVFAAYADAKARDYPDNIARDLQISGVIVRGREDIIKFCDALNAYFQVEEEDRLLSFSWRGREAVDVARLKKPKNIIALVSGAFLSVAAFFLLAALLQSDSQRIDEVLAADFPSQKISLTAAADNFIPPASANPATVNEKIVERVERLIEDGAFLSALSMLRDSLYPLDAESAKAIKIRIDRLVVLKADSLTIVIESLAAKGKYQEAFDLEQCFDKDVFRLAGSSVAKDLRSRLLTDWVYSYKGSKSKEEAMATVTDQVRKVLKNSSYAVAATSEGKMYLEYGNGVQAKKDS